jgi:hypothetical protein
MRPGNRPGSVVAAHIQPGKLNAGPRQDAHAERLRPVPHVGRHTCTPSTLRGSGGPERRSVMTKSGDSGPKSRARKAQRSTGVSYTHARGH